MVEICDICGKEVQNKQALKIHKLSCEKAKKLAYSEKPKDKTVYNDGSFAPITEPSDDLEIEEELETPEETEGENFCPECNCQLKDYESPCPNCGAVIEWGD